jgi:DNA polymerase-3 subunit beta
MQFTLPANTLASALATIAPALGKSDLLAYAKLSLSDGLTLSAQDGELSIVHRLPDVTGTRGECLVAPGRLKALADLVGGDVSFVTSNELLAVEAGPDRFHLPIADVNGWPTIPISKNTPTFAMPSVDLKAAIARVCFAAGGESERYTTSGVLFDLDAGKLNLVATDGKRLAWWKGDSGGKASAIVPQRAIRALASAEGEMCSVWITKNGATFAVGDTTIVTKLHEGPFMPYRDTVPKPKAIKASVVLVAGEFRSAAERAALMTDDETKRVDFTFAKESVTLRARGATSGDATVVHPLTGGAEFGISFDPDALVGRAGLMRVLDGDERITLDLIAPDKPAVFRSGKNWVCAVVPLA